MASQNTVSLCLDTDVPQSLLRSAGSDTADGSPADAERNLADRQPVRIAAPTEKLARKMAAELPIAKLVKFSAAK